MKVVGVTVTYGTRHALCLEAVAAFLRNGVDHIIIISNGSSSASLAALESLAEEEGSVTLLRNIENRGSAPAFAQGISAALDCDAEWVWVLDDDNVPADNALHEALNVAGADPYLNVAVSCVRDSDESHRQILDGVSIPDAYPPPGSFFGVDVIRRLQRKWVRSAPGGYDGGNVRLPQAPYGGLLLARETILQNGLPREGFVLYFDDVEFTRRLVANGTPLLFSSRSVIHDQDTKWADHDGGTYVSAMVRSGDVRKIFYSYRNSTLIDWSSAEKSGVRLRFALNFVIYFGYVAFTARIKDIWFTRLFLLAALDGFRGRLGPNRLADRVST